MFTSSKMSDLCVTLSMVWIFVPEVWTECFKNCWSWDFQKQQFLVFIHHGAEKQKTSWGCSGWNTLLMGEKNERRMTRLVRADRKTMNRTQRSMMFLGNKWRDAEGPAFVFRSIDDVSHCLNTHLHVLRTSAGLKSDIYYSFYTSGYQVGLENV